MKSQYTRNLNISLRTAHHYTEWIEKLCCGLLADRSIYKMTRYLQNYQISGHKSQNIEKLAKKCFDTVTRNHDGFIWGLKFSAYLYSNMHILNIL